MPAMSQCCGPLSGRLLDAKDSKDSISSQSTEDPGSNDGLLDAKDSKDSISSQSTEDPGSNDGLLDAKDSKDSISSQSTEDPGSNAGLHIPSSLDDESSGEMNLREMNQLFSVAVISSELPVNLVDDDFFQIDVPSDVFELGESSDLLELGDTTPVIASRNVRLERYPACANITTEYLLSIGVI